MWFSPQTLSTTALWSTTARDPATAPAPTSWSGQRSPRCGPSTPEEKPGDCSASPYAAESDHQSDISATSRHAILMHDNQFLFAHFAALHSFTVTQRGRRALSPPGEIKFLLPSQKHDTCVFCLCSSAVEEEQTTQQRHNENPDLWSK